MFATNAFLLLLLISPSPGESATAFDYSTPSEVLRTSTGRIRGARNRSQKDFVLGGLFPIHVAAEGGGTCGKVRLERGLERMEAMLFALDMINSDENLLPGLSLGYDIRDTCSIENIGLDEAVDLVITNSQIDIQSCRSGIMTNDSLRGSAPTSGIVGAASSRVSVPVASLVRLFTTPQVSYASSSAILSNRDRYEYFYRTIPPDNLQARAMIDIMLHFNWTYVSTIYSRNPYGEPGIIAFQTLAKRNGICIDIDEGIEDDYTEAQFAALAQRLIDSQANVVIVFTSQDNAEALLGHIANSTSAHRFIWIASDAWARSINVVHRFNSTAAGLYGFAPLTDHLSTFQDYFSNLTINSNRRNPWFEEFYTAFANCTLNTTSNVEQQCDRNASVTEQLRYEQGNFIPLVVDAVYTYAVALHNFLSENCEQPVQWSRENRTCLNQSRSLTGRVLLEYIQQVDFDSPTGNRVLFDSEGNVEGRYEILNYQAVDMIGGRHEYGFKRVGIWDSSLSNDTDQEALTLQPGVRLQFGVNEVGQINYSIPESQCSRCNPGQYRRLVLSSCCGICEPCLGRNYSNDTHASRCNMCPQEKWGNNPLEGSNHCVGLQEEFLRINHPFSIIIMIIALIGLLGVVFTSIVYGLYWKTPVVKSSGREQMILLLIGITLCFISAFFFVSPPSPAICGIQRWLLWTCFAVMFGALLVKIVRVARIFLRKKNISRPRFTEPHYQVLFTFIIILIQWVIIAISSGVQVPDVRRTERLIPDTPNNFPTIVLTCVGEKLVFLILSVAYETILVIACTILGGLSFSYPENFNEAKYVAFCSLCILIIWIALIITYFATQTMQEFQNIAISLAVVMTGYAVLLCLFSHKLFIILFQPDRNVTTKFSHHGTNDLSTVPNSGGGGKNRWSVTPSMALATPIMDRKQAEGTFIANY